MAKDNSQIAMEDMQQTIYKELGYKSYPFPFTTPAYLEAYGALVGLNTPPAKTARVLELGATYGGNIISQAVFNPEATFVGIELSQDQVEKGNQIICDAKLENVSLVQGDILNFDESMGTFDYIIAHGFYSWINDEMKDKLLNIISNHLADNGILPMCLTIRIQVGIPWKKYVSSCCLLILAKISWPIRKRCCAVRP